MKFILLLLTTLFFFAAYAEHPEKKSDKTYDEVYRPQFHFTPEKGILSTPAGLVFYSGEYHMFYQYQPDTLATAPIQWGHAVSKDLVKWENLPVFNLGDNCTPYSGSAVVDEKNVTGLQQGAEKTLLLYYTGKECGQCLAYSNDKGRTWKKYEKSPVIPASNDNANGPKVIFDPASGKWIMTLYRWADGDENKQGISFYTSDDLLHWNFQSHLTGFSGCADLYKLPVDSNTGNQKWVLAGANNEYLVGAFDGKTFTAETNPRKQDMGRNFMAAHSWTNLPDGKVIQIAWMRGGKYPRMPFDGQMSFPCELSLKSTKVGPLLCRQPVSLEPFYSKDLKKKQKNLIPGIKGNLVGSINGDALLIKGVFDPKTSDGFGFILRNGKNTSGTVVKYEQAKKILDCLSRQMLVEPKNGKLELEILVDRASVEIFANGGEAVLSSCFNPDPKDNDLVLWTQGGELFVDQLEVYTIKSIWN
jgi:levanase/fructan beta-fructosidase